MHMASLHIPCVLRWPGTNLSAYELLHTASLQISCVLSQSGTNAKERGYMCTASLHISWVLNWSGVTIIKCRIISGGFILFCLFSWVRVKFYGQEKWHHAQATPRRSFYRRKKPMKTSLNLRWFNYWRYTLNYDVYRCINNEYTAENGGAFLKKRWKHTLKRSFYH